MVPEAESVVMPASKSEKDWSLRFVPFGSGPCTRTSTAERDAVAMSMSGFFSMCFFPAAERRRFAIALSRFKKSNGAVGFSCPVLYGECRLHGVELYLPTVTSGTGTLPARTSSSSVHLLLLLLQPRFLGSS